jgi:hypothetical protein
MKKYYLFLYATALFILFSSCFAHMPKPVPGGGTIPPQGGNVIVYYDMKYTGAAKVFSTGNYDAGNLGGFAENISSIYVPASLSVLVTDRSGRSQTFTNSMSNLQQDGWDNRIYTITVNKR